MNQVKISKVVSKKNVYFLCVLALNLIEFLRATGNGDVWKTAANCTGLVIMVLIASACDLKRFLCPFSYIYTVACAAAMIFVRFHWERHIGEYSLGQVETAVLNVWWIGLIAYYLFIKIFIRKEKEIHISVLGLIITAFVVWTIIGVSRKLWPLWYYLMFGAFYLTDFSKDDWEALWNAVIDGTIFSFFIIQGYAYLFRPYDMVRYCGAFSNCNMMALYYLIIYAMVLCKLHQLHLKNAKKGWKLFYFIGAGGLQGFMFMTLSRTSWMASIILTLLYGLIVLRKIWKDTWRKLLRRGCAFVICILLTFPLVYLTVRYLPAIHPHPIWYDGEYTVTKVHPWDPADSEKYVSIRELMEAAFGRIGTLFEWLDVRNPLVLKVYAHEAETVAEPTVIYSLDIPWLDSSMRVRLSAAKVYLQDSTWLGHPDEDENYIWESNKLRVWHSQNFWVQMTYTFGYPAGVLSVIATILLLHKFLKLAKTGGTSCNILPFLICVVFILYGLADIVWNAGQLIFTLIFMIAHPQFRQGEVAFHCIKKKTDSTM